MMIMSKVPFMQFRTFISHRKVFILQGKMKSGGIKSSPNSGNYSPIKTQNVQLDRQISMVAKGDHSSTSGARNSPGNLINGVDNQPKNLFDPANEDEFPSLASVKNVPSKNKRRTRLELGTQLGLKSGPGVVNTGSPQPNPSLRSNSMSRTDRLRLASNVPEQGQIIKDSGISNKYKPYDICPRESSKQVSTFPSRSDRQHFNGTSSEGGVKNPRETEFKPFDICFSDNRKQVVPRPSIPTKEQCIQMDSANMENGEVLRPGMILLKSYIPLGQQVEIVSKCRELGLGTGGFYQPGYEDGAKLRLHMMCLGLDWDPQTRQYGRIRQHDNSIPPDIPFDFSKLVESAILDSHILIKQTTRRNDVEKILPYMSPDICIVNFYTINGRLGLHQDRDESKDSLHRGLPVVSISIGDSAEFLYGDKRDIDKAESVLLESGDVLIFGGKSRHVFHGVTSIIPKTAPPALREHSRLRPGRLNLTFRQH